MDPGVRRDDSEEYGAAFVETTRFRFETHVCMHLKTRHKIGEQGCDE
jgi:hypothetical protein